jgi:soluble lytic murein transglycosylase-like protein
MNKLLGIVAIVAILLFFVMGAAGPGSKMGQGWQYLTTGSTTLQSSGNPQAQAAGADDLHAIARQDAIDNHIDPTLFERQISAESAWNPDAVSRMGAIGIAQIMPSTASGWHVDPHDPVASLSAAAKAMAWYQNHYGSYEKALACYNAGTDALDRAMAQYGADWKIGLPAETQTYIRRIMGN